VAGTVAFANAFANEFDIELERGFEIAATKNVTWLVRH
jgi:hypothetical protein